MKIVRSIPSIVLAAVIALAATGLASAADKTLTIGVLGPLSGGAAQYGVDLVRGAELRTDEINKAGGLKIGGKETYGIDRQFLYPVVISEIRDGKVVDLAQVHPTALKK